MAQTVLSNGEIARPTLVLGWRVVTFTIGDIRRSFSVHEDLICTTSREFRNLLQGNRKVIEGECAICYVVLDASKDEITFCRAQCGHNFHEHCIHEWTQSQSEPANCPMCRQPWREDSKEAGHMLPAVKWITESSMHTYLGWLYTGHVHIAESTMRDSANFGLRILEAWVTATWVEDKAFRCAVAATFLAENKHAKGFGHEAIRYAFDGMEDDVEESDDEDDWESPFLHFVVDVYIMAGAAETFRTDYKLYTEAFTKLLSYVLLERAGKELPTREEMLEKYADGRYKIED